MARFLFSIHHPAHVHFFRNAISELSNDGHQVRVVARDKDVTCDLLDHYDVEHDVISTGYSSVAELLYQNLKHEVKLLDISYNFKPDVMASIGSGVLTAYISKLIGCASIAFYDTENARIQNKIGYPAVDAIYTPDCYKGDMGEKHQTYPGYHELAYLHPNRFQPDPMVLEEAGLERDEKFVILRLISWDAIHDLKDSGFDNVVDVVETLEETGVTVRITSEDNLPESIEDRKVSIPPHKIHDLMSYADLYIGESATMATESAVLGTPSVFVSSSSRGYTDELEQEFGLIFNFHGDDRHNNGLKKSLNILREDPEPSWEARRERLLENKIDTTNYIIGILSKTAKTEKVPAK